MRCPNCPESIVMRRHRRLGIYPVPIMLLCLGYHLALLWVTGRKWRWACPSCGQIQDRRSSVGWISWILFWIGLGLNCLIVLFAIALVLRAGIFDLALE